MSASESKPKHNTPPIDIEDFRPGYLKPQSYSAEDISKVVIDLASRSEGNYTERQLQGIEKLKAYGGWNLSKAENCNDLKMFFDIFNDFYFNGVLTGYCTVSFHCNRRSMWGTSMGAICYDRYPGRAQHPRFKIERLSCDINIRKRYQDDVEKRFSTIDQIEVYQNRILHQMLHAVFEIYTCYCSGCSEKNRNYLLAGSHSEPWLAAAHAIEKADRFDLPRQYCCSECNPKNCYYYPENSDNDENGDDKKIDPQKRGSLGRPKFGLDLERNRAVAFNVHNGANLPPEPELRRLGVCIKSVCLYMEERRWREAVRYEDEQRERQLMKANQCLRDYWTVESDADFYEKLPGYYFIYIISARVAHM